MEQPTNVIDATARFAARRASEEDRRALAIVARINRMLDR